MTGTRLIFLLAIALLPLAAAGETPQNEPSAVEKSKARAEGVVWRTADPRSVTGVEVDRARIRSMVAFLISGVTGTENTAAAWRTLVNPGEIVGIEINASGGPILGTRRSVVDAVAEGLLEAGIPPARIIVWDRDRAALVRAGYINATGRSMSPKYTVRWIDRPEGLDPEAKIYAARSGTLIWGDHAFQIGRGKSNTSNMSHLPTLLTKDIDALIHLPTPTQANGVGLLGAIAGVTAGVVDNQRRFFTGPEEMLADAFAHNAVRGKLRLTIMDALYCQYAGGPGPLMNESQPLRQLWAGWDPVAIDTHGLREIDRFRATRKWPPATPLAAYLPVAEWLGLGLSDVRVIDVRP